MRLLLLVPRISYRATDFLNAAERLKVDVVVASDVRQTLEEAGGTLTLDFLDLQGATEAVLSFSARYTIDAVVSTDEESTLLAAILCQALSLPHNPLAAVETAKDKSRLREVLSAASVPTPAHQIFQTDQSPEAAAVQVNYPVVLKPTFLSASRGVIRADDPEAFCTAFRRIRQLLSEPELQKKGGASAKKSWSSRLCREERSHWKDCCGRADSLCWPFLTSPIRWTDPSLKRRSTSPPPASVPRFKGQF